jgi:hypothetical protein
MFKLHDQVGVSSNGRLMKATITKVLKSKLIVESDNAIWDFRHDGRSMGSRMRGSVPLRLIPWTAHEEYLWQKSRRCHLAWSAVRAWDVRRLMSLSDEQLKTVEAAIALVT